RSRGESAVNREGNSVNCPRHGGLGNEFVGEQEGTPEADCRGSAGNHGWVPSSGWATDDVFGVGRRVHRSGRLAYSRGARATGRSTGNAPGRMSLSKLSATRHAPA